MSNINVLVSGIAGDIGFGVGRILRDYPFINLLCGIDMQSRHAGAAVFDHCEVAPAASSAGYLQWLGWLIKAQAIDVFIPTSEAEISLLTEQGIRRLGNAQILMTNEMAVLNSLDKHLCMGFLADRGISAPRHGRVGIERPEGYPVIVKPRSGQGSKGLRKVDNPQDLDTLSDQNLVWQELLLPDSEEYTCAVYRSSRVGTRTLVMKRELQGGFTSRGEIVADPRITGYVESIADVLEVEGVINIQLRLTDAGPLLFEINPRLSSTLVFRDKLGFSDLRWWLADMLGMNTDPYVAPAAGTRFYRGVQEYIFFADNFS